VRCGMLCVTGVTVLCVLYDGVLQCVAARDSVLQCVAVCCNVLQCVAVLCSTRWCAEGTGAEQKRMGANQDCTILWYKKSMLAFEMTKCSK